MSSHRRPVVSGSHTSFTPVNGVVKVVPPTPGAAGKAGRPEPSRPEIVGCQQTAQSNTEWHVRGGKARPPPSGNAVEETRSSRGKFAAIPPRSGSESGTHNAPAVGISLQTGSVRRLPRCRASRVHEGTAGNVRSAVVGVVVS